MYKLYLSYEFLSVLRFSLRKSCGETERRKVLPPPPQKQSTIHILFGLKKFFFPLIVWDFTLL